MPIEGTLWAHLPRGKWKSLGRAFHSRVQSPRVTDPKKGYGGSFSLALPIRNLQVLVKWTDLCLLASTGFVKSFARINLYSLISTSILSPPVTLITYCCVVSTLFTCEEFTCSHLYFFAWSSFNETALTVVTQRLNILLTHILHNSLWNMFIIGGSMPYPN